MKVFRFPLQLFHLNRLRMDLAMVIHHLAKVIHYLAMVIRLQGKVSASHWLSAK